MYDDRCDSCRALSQWFDNARERNYSYKFERARSLARSPSDRINFTRGSLRIAAASLDELARMYVHACKYNEV